jgi:hypothetical protein
MPPKRGTRTKATAETLTETLTGGDLPPILAGPPSWAPVGYVATPKDFRELSAPGRRRATRKDVEAAAAEWNRTPARGRRGPG